MVCIYCGHSTHVTNSRVQKRQNTVWRRRSCNTCKSVFSTREQPVHAQSILIRTSHAKKLQPFSRDALFLSIYEACKHRTAAMKEAAALTETVMALALKALQDSVIERDMLVKTAQTVLSRFDDTAARVYTAYHPL